MRKTFILLFAVTSLVACKNGSTTNEEVAAVDSTSVSTEETAEEQHEDEVDYPYQAGAEFDASLAVTPVEMLEMRKGYDGDSLDVVLAANINECCKKKGCWMTIDLENGDDMLVRFRDYDFFVPLNADGRSTILKGKVFRDTVSVETLRHYAEDAGASADSIAKITEPTISYSFLADGVVVN
ncbi:MAG: DUF4920 domain-containing protein [Crocinitomicaceae bacterium]|nr:DUF4920 domain-containing protein [Crocinitomicaceae bacterium]|tara:strand:+ start:131 stop:676 length:546 start_codon:yes stop_codon:yes gene_type:complete